MGVWFVKENTIKFNARSVEGVKKNNEVYYKNKYNVIQMITL